MTTDSCVIASIHELVQIGREVEECYVSPMSRRDGSIVRALTNIEMWGWIYYNRKQGGPILRIAKSWCVRWDSLFKEVLDER